MNGFYYMLINKPTYIHSEKLKNNKMWRNSLSLTYKTEEPVKQILFIYNTATNYIISTLS